MGGKTKDLIVLHGKQATHDIEISFSLVTLDETVFRVHWRRIADVPTRFPPPLGPCESREEV